MERLQDILDIDDYGDVFTPGSPVERPDFFFGRDEQLADLRDMLNWKGFHPIVIGDRGVGKTSVIVQAFNQSELPAVVVTCNSKMTSDRFARAALRALGVDTTEIESEDETERVLVGRTGVFGIGVEGGGKNTSKKKRRKIGADEIDPWRMFEELRDLGQKVVIVLDEYDVIPAANTEFHHSVAELIKTLADNSRFCDSRIVVVGIARSAETLLGRHDSITRSVRELYLHPLNDEAVLEFLTTAERELGFQFIDNVRHGIVDAAAGYPYFVHLVGLESVRVMRRRDPEARIVDEHDYKVGIKRSVNEAFRSALKSYRAAVKKLSDDHVAILRELAFLSRRKSITVGDLQRRVLHVSEGVTRDAFAEMLTDLYRRRLLYTKKTTNQIKFVEPLMAPFLRAVIFPMTGPDIDTRQLSLFSDIWGGLTSHSS